MKINSVTITNFNSFGNNYSTNIQFKSALGPRPPKIVRKASILDKLTVGLNKIGNENLLIVADSFKSAKEHFKKNLENFATPISKLVLMAIPGMAQVLAFEKTNEQKALWNMGKRVIFVDDNLIPPDVTVSLNDDSLVVFNSGQIDLSEQPKNVSELESLSKYFIEEYDYTKKYDEMVQKYNKSILTKICGDEEVDDVQTDVAKKNSNGRKNILDFSSIGGQDHIIKDIKRNIIFPLRYPEAFKGFQTNKGMIFYGPPGTGKSLMADIICIESGASCFKISGAELDNKYVGESEKNWRELHQKAIDSQPSIIFIDEIDAVARDRSGKDAYGDKVLNQILALMSDDEKSDRNIFWIGATNKVDSLDSAITRSGRFGKKYEFLAPATAKDVEQIFNIHTRNIPVSKDLDKESLFSKMLKLKSTGADIKLIVDDARINAFERMEIFESMDKGIFSPMMLDFVELTNDDFNKAVETFSKGKKNRQPIGYTSQNI